ncbi:DUF6612 family protein [Virgibacillus kekensis]|uniref:DUF6612 family protein n=1 Tax=Virgibacillus kekensis TaxID=202261 RepID=A0ABV9DQ59_9BACI
MKKFLLATLTLVMLTVLAACGQSANSNGGESNNSNGEAPKKEEKIEELTPQEIITKSSETMQDWSGIHYVMDGTQTIDASKGDQNFTFDQTFSMETKMTMDPMTMHMTGTMKMQDQQAPIENYYLDSTMYTKAPQGWIAIEGMNLDQFQKQTQGQDPSQTMKQFTEMLDKISSESNTKDIITMEEQDNMYVITMDLNEEASSQVMDIIKEQTKSVMQQIEQMGIPNVMENMKIRGLKQTFFIDKKTFDQKKM